MKTFFIICTIILTLFIFGQRQCSPSESTEVVAEKTSTPQSTTPSAISTTQPDNPGWKYTGFENGYWIYQPEDSTITETAWFCIQDWNTTYALRDCIMQFKKKDGSIVSFKWDSGKEKHYLETSPGVFSKEPWNGYLETGMASTHVRFKKISDPFNVTVGRKKLDM